MKRGRDDRSRPDGIWPSIARAILRDGLPPVDVVGPPVLPGTRLDFRDRDAARIIRALELNLALAGIVISDDN